jgi:hypothetical protein
MPPELLPAGDQRLDGAWRVLSEGSEHFCREAPRGVIRDLLGTGS